MSLDVAQWILRGILALVFVGMGINHFVPRSAHVMSKMIPPGMRRDGLLSPLNLVYFTGLCEIAGGLGLLIPPLSSAAGMALVVFLVAVFPANVYAAAHRETFGPLAIPFWPRYLGQLAFVLLVILAAL